MKTFSVTLVAIFCASLSFSSVTLAHNRHSPQTDNFKYHAPRISQHQHKKHHWGRASRYHSHHQSHSSSPIYSRHSQWVLKHAYNKYYQQRHDYQHFKAAKTKRHSVKQKTHSKHKHYYRTAQSNQYRPYKSSAMSIYLNF